MPLELSHGFSSQDSDGKGENAISTMKKPIYIVMRVYQPKGTVEFPSIKLDRK
jgi:hypothetical protein